MSFGVELFGQAFWVLREMEADLTLISSVSLARRAVRNRSVFSWRA